MRVRSQFFIWLMLVLVVITLPQVEAQSAIDEISVVDVETTGFPQLLVHFRALDRLRQPISGLTTAAFDVQESGTSVIPDSILETEGELWVHFVIDAGSSLGPTSIRWQNTKQAILEFVETRPWMNENLDHVAITAVEASGRRELIAFSTDSNSIATIVDDYAPPGGTAYSNPLPVINDIVSELNSLPQTEGDAKVVVFLTATLERVTPTVAAEITETALATGIYVYTVNTRGGSDSRTGDDVVEALATDTYGRYIRYASTTSMTLAYENLVGHRHLYELSYRSVNNISGTRPVIVTANVGGVGAVSDSGSYDITIDPPRVQITSHEGEGKIIVCETEVYTTDFGSVCTQPETVLATVTYADGYIRRVRQATLLVNGVERGQLTNPAYDGMEFSWDLREVENRGRNSFTLQVEIVDELGMPGTSLPVQVDVDVIAPESPPTVVMNPPEFATAIATFIPTPTPDPCENATNQTVCVLGQGFKDNAIALMSLSIAFGAVAFSGVILWRNWDRPAMVNARNTVRGVVDSLTKRYRGPTEAKAYLEVLQGDVNVGKSLEVFGDTPIGRSKQHAELLFQQHDDTSPISRLHCSIIDHESHFVIKDEDSANGTFVNGRRLQPMTEEPLHDGDEIELARVERGGVRLRFRKAKPADLDSGYTEPFGVTRPTAPPQPPPGSPYQQGKGPH